jgi:hypothetical protein
MYSCATGGAKYIHLYIFVTPSQRMNDNMIVFEGGKTWARRR